MSLSISITPHLPPLRRFARALTGSQASGDAYVAAALEAIAGRADFPADRRAVKRHLFGVFLAIWSAMPVNHLPESERATGAVGTADRSLGGLTPLPRVAFLLRALEGFDTEEIAVMLDCPVAEVEILQERAGREITEQLSTDVLIIEDEPVIAMDLESLVHELGHRVTLIARTHTEAVAAVKQQAPGLVLADIQLADGSSGLDAANEILAEASRPVVFITAYPASGC